MNLATDFKYIVAQEVTSLSVSKVTGGQRLKNNPTSDNLGVRSSWEACAFYVLSKCVV